MKKSIHSEQQKKLLELLKQVRIDAKISQTDLAKLLEKPQSYVSKIESGERRLDVIEFIRICKAIKCDHAAILKDL